MKRRWQIIIYTGIILAATLLPFLAFEGILRLGGYGHSGALFAVDSLRTDDNTYIVDKYFYARFFPASDREWILNSGNWGWEISKEKEAGTVRIFILGGSVALGDQTDYAFSNARILEVMLRKSFPGTKFEIFNLACGALNSHVMRRAATEAAAFSPDIFLVYMGNNEYIGPYGPAWSPGGMPLEADQVQWRISVQELRLVQLLNSLSSSDKYLISGGPQGVFEHTVKVRPSDAGRQTMYRSFKRNLLNICETASKSGVRTILCTIGNNLRNWTPYASLHKRDLSAEDLEKWNGYFTAGVDAQDHWDGDTANWVRQALDYYTEAEKIDACYADLQFRLGECRWLLGEYDEARSAFTRARDYDGFAIRADSIINEIIRECTARHEGTMLADIEDLFIRTSDNGIMGGGLFYDYVHVLFTGDYLIASGVFAEVRKVLLDRFHREPVRDMLSLDECKQALGMSRYLEALFLKRVVEEVEVSRTYNTRLDIHPLKEQLAKVESDINDQSFDSALEALQSTELYKEGDVHISRLLVELLQGAGRGEEAKAEAVRITGLFPNRPDARRISGMLSQ